MGLLVSADLSPEGERQTDREWGGEQRSVRNDGAQPRLCQLNLERKGEKNIPGLTERVISHCFFVFFSPATHRTDGSAGLF